MTRPLIFVVGVPRSGTTIMGAILGLNSSVFTLRELHFFDHIWSRRGQKRSLTDSHRTAVAATLLSRQRVGLEHRPDPGPFVSEATALLRAERDHCRSSADVLQAFLHYEAALHGKAVACDHTPPNVFYAKDIVSLYPGARVINMVRDPRDVLASRKYRWRVRADVDPLHETLRRRVDYHPVTASRLWRAATRAGDDVVWHERVRTLRFEDLLRDPEQELRSVCGFLGLGFEPHMLEVPQVNSSFGGAGAAPRGINPAAAGRWRTALTPSEVAICQWVTRNGMRRHRYTPTSEPRRPRGLARGLASLPAQAALARLMSSGRLRKPIGAAERLKAVRKLVGDSARQSSLSL